MAVLLVRLAVLILVKIDICQYSTREMKRQTDPDVRLLQAAADPTRLAILRQLSDCEEVCACDFTECCDLTQPTVSHHLKVLREAGWIAGERRGTWIWYSLRPEAVARFRQLAGGFSTAGASPPVPARTLPVVQPPA
jgi:ArsR family transcriptional regulator